MSGCCATNVRTWEDGELNRNLLADVLQSGGGLAERVTFWFVVDDRAVNLQLGGAVAGSQLGAGRLIYR